MKEMKFLYFNCLCLLLIVFNSLILAKEEQKKAKIDFDEIIESALGENKESKNIALLFIKKERPLIVARKLVVFLIINEGKKSEQKIINLLNLFDKKRVVPLWIEVLSKVKSTPLKIKIIKILGKTNDKRIVLPVSQELDNPIQKIRKEAILVLKNIGDDRMFAKIIQMASAEKAIFRFYAVRALIHVYDFRFESLIYKLFKDKNKSIRILALQCIEENKLTKMLPVVRSLGSNDINWEVRIKAINVLGNLWDRKAYYVLLKNISHSNREVRYATAINLYKFMFSKSVYPVSSHLLLENDYEIKNVLLDLLEKKRNAGNFNGLKKIILEDASIKLRLKAVYILGLVKNGRSGSVLISVKSNQNYKVKAEICYSLGKLRYKSAANFLLHEIKNHPQRYVRSAALYAIKKINNKKINNQLIIIEQSEKDPVFKMILNRVLR